MKKLVSLLLIIAVCGTFFACEFGDITNLDTAKVLSLSLPDVDLIATGREWFDGYLITYYRGELHFLGFVNLENEIVWEYELIRNRTCVFEAENYGFLLFTAKDGEDDGLMRIDSNGKRLWKRDKFWKRQLVQTIFSDNDGGAYLFTTRLLENPVDYKYHINKDGKLTDQPPLEQFSWLNAVLLDSPPPTGFWAVYTPTDNTKIKYFANLDEDFSVINSIELKEDIEDINVISGNNNNLFLYGDVIKNGVFDYSFIYELDLDLDISNYREFTSNLVNVAILGDHGILLHLRDADEEDVIQCYNSGWWLFKELKLDYAVNSITALWSDGFVVTGTRLKSDENEEITEPILSSASSVFTGKMELVYERYDKYNFELEARSVFDETFSYFITRDGTIIQYK